MNITGPKIYFTLFGLIPITQTTVTSFLVMVILCVAGILLGRNLKKRPGRMQVIVEKGVGLIYGLVEDAMGKHNADWAPFVGTLFMTSLLGSLLGMTGFLRSSTADVSTTATWAVLISLICWYQSIKNSGFLPWLKGFTEPIVVMTPMNIVSEFAQPVSLAFRHFGNIAGGGVITTMLYWALAGASSALLGVLTKNGYVICGILIALGLLLIFVRWKKHRSYYRIGGVALAIVGAVGLAQTILAACGVSVDIPILQVGIPAVLSLYFDVFSGVMQAFVFTLLSMIYISNACPPPEERRQRKPRKTKVHS